MIEIPWAEAESIVGHRLDRRKKYAKADEGVFELVLSRHKCAGCSSDAPNEERGAGCPECGYMGIRRRQPSWVQWVAPLPRETVRRGSLDHKEIPEVKRFEAESLFERCHTVPESGCWLWEGVWSPNGYGRMTALLDDKKVFIQPTRAMYVAVNGPIPKGHHICHKCDTPPCINPSHLFAGTARENTADRIRKGRQAGRKLTKSQALAIFHDPRSPIVVAIEYGVQTGTVISIRNGRTWAHLTQKDSHHD